MAIDAIDDAERHPEDVNGKERAEGIVLAFCRTSLKRGEVPGFGDADADGEGGDEAAPEDGEEAPSAGLDLYYRTGSTAIETFLLDGTDDKELKELAAEVVEAAAEDLANAEGVDGEMYAVGFQGGNRRTTFSLYFGARFPRQSSAAGGIPRPPSRGARDRREPPLLSVMRGGGESAYGGDDVPDGDELRYDDRPDEHKARFDERERPAQNLVVDVASRLVGLSLSHQMEMKDRDRDTVAMSIEVVQRSNDDLRAENASLRKQVNDLVDRQRQLLDWEREVLLNHHQHELDLRECDRKANRDKMAWEGVSKTLSMVVPPLLASIFARIGMPPAMMQGIMGAVAHGMGPAAAGGAPGPNEGGSAVHPAGGGDIPAEAARKLSVLLDSLDEAQYGTLVAEAKIHFNQEQLQQLMEIQVAIKQAAAGTSPAAG